MWQRADGTGAATPLTKAAPGVVHIPDRRQQEGIRNIYSVTISPAAAKRTAFRQYLQTFFGGSRRLMLTSLVREGSWSDEDLEALRTEIDKVRKERAKS